MSFFSLVPIAVAAALFISLIECLLILPLHVMDMERLFGPDTNVVEHGDEVSHTGIMGKIDAIYCAILNYNLKHPFLVISSVTLLFFMAVGLLIYSFTAPQYGRTPLLKNKFFPDDTSVIDVYIRMNSGTPLEETDRVVRKISRQIADMGTDHIASVTGLTGLTIDKAYRPAFGNQYGMLNLEVPSKDTRAYDDVKKFISELDEKVKDWGKDENGSFEVSARQGGPPVGAPVNIRLTGLDDETIMAMTTDLLAWLHSENTKEGSLYGLKDLSHDRQQTTTVLSFIPNREDIAQFGLSDQQVQMIVADAIDGAYVGELRRSDDDIPIRAQLDREALKNFDDYMSIPIANNPSGQVVRFTDIGHIEQSPIPSRPIRRDFQRTVTITGGLRDDAAIDATNLIPIVRAWVDENSKNYPGVSVAFGGEAESTGKSYASLFLAFGVAVAIIYAVLATQFKSYMQPFIIMSNIVFSFTGVIFALAGFGFLALMFPGMVYEERSYFTVQVFIAVVGLTGLVINDAIVLIDFINKRRADGMDLVTAVFAGGRERMRPIIMTTATTIAGLLPMAIGVPDFSITWGPFATSFITGLIFSTTMTLLVLPVLYLVLIRMISFMTTTILPTSVHERIYNSDLSSSKAP